MDPGGRKGEHSTMKHVALVALLVLFTTGSKPTFIADRDPGGCTVERVVTKADERSFQCNSFSPDGRLIAIGWDRGEENRGTYIFNLDTGERTPVPEFNNGTTFSPDGTMFLNAVYVESGKTDLFEMNIETREVNVIAQHDQWEWLPCYSPDGTMIAFNSYRTGNSDIYLYDRASEELRQLTSTDMYEAHAQFSPDSKRIVFHRQVGEVDFNIYVLDLASNEETQLTDSPREEGYPSWAPDGRHIFFCTDEGNEIGKPNIAVMTDKGEFVRQLTNHPAKDAYPFASPDGRYVYFNSYRDPQGVYRIKLDGEFSCERSEGD